MSSQSNSHVVSCRLIQRGKTPDLVGIIIHNDDSADITEPSVQRLHCVPGLAPTYHMVLGSCHCVGPGHNQLPAAMQDLLSLFDLQATSMPS